MHRVDIVIIGAGVVGLAVAAELSNSLTGQAIVVMERHHKFGMETSSRNSEVIHAGMYYPDGSLKARLCVEGNRLLYQFCKVWGVPHKRLGKLIIARTAEEVPVLESILNQGLANGVTDLELLEAGQVRQLEPHVAAVAAILSPSTGVIDSHALMYRLEYQARCQGTMFAYRHAVTMVERSGAGYRLTYRGPDGQSDWIYCDWLINSAGLWADKIPSWLGLDVEQAGYRIYPCKGEYFGVSNAKSGLVSRLIYPPPLKELKGLGIHATKALDGRLRFGPSAFYVQDLDYSVDEEHASEFYRAIKSYLPFIDLADLQPEIAGIRPKIQGPGDPVRDFVVRHEVEHGLAGLINLIGIESPGLTSSLSLAGMVANMIGKE
ncbi:L-2-hydroxyglutarate oxidase LhgO [Sporotomaculum syntrophicum]|uniref:L-2-hydroxyglutarate oxidase LhgO n=1 Tax=Sporotomaculum syntrophicum TaxID=182264 RepID=A0A9D3AXR6_9FIRM|nr:NAD(P)/FAD-dependent oxidoreductase [Sporotomaculum syntrophicum]KAF1084731.1 L-2-hydroxyglutarate oxidase LhgO [Sporotomaculum syntrophicum]